MTADNKAFDLICVGSGVGGCAAALAGAERGLRVCLVEKSDRLGGGSAYSTGGLWVGANLFQEAAGIDDSLEETRRYLDFVAGGAAIEDNLAALVRESPKALRAFVDMGLRFRLTPDIPDHYYPSAPGSKPCGRNFHGEAIQRRELGPWAELIVDSPYSLPGVTNTDIAAWGGRANMRDWDPVLLEQRAASGDLGAGAATVGQFIAALVRRAGAIMTNFAARELIVRDGRVRGLAGTRDGKPATLEARRGVVLATGGYEGNAELVRRYESLPGWRSMFPDSVTGDGMIMAAELGAAIHRMAENFFVFLGYEIPGEGAGAAPRFRMVGHTELSFPHGMVVNRAGRRFCDESMFQTVVPKLREFDPASRDHPNLPCFFIFDRNFQERYTFAGRPPGSEAPAWLARSGSIRGLAGRLGIDADGLADSVARFNEAAAEGADPEFGRGRFLWVKMVSGDAGNATHPNLAPVADPPFYGVRLHPTASSTAGLLTNADGQVMHVRGHPIDGLYACGTTAATTDYGVGYQAGLHLTRGMTFGYLAARHAALAQGDGDRIRDTG